MIEPGWTALYPRRPDDKDKNDDEQELPEFHPGERGPHEPFLRAGETTPPKHYTENTLLGAMETAGKLVDDEQLKEALKEKGLGTPATRAAIIETLLQRGYIARDKKTLTATDLGRYLVALIQDRHLKSPELTGEWEAKLREIESGRLDPRQFMREIVRVHRRPHPLRRLVRARREQVGRVPTVRPPGDRGEARVRLLGMAGGMPVRALEDVQGPNTEWGANPGASPAPRPASAEIDRGLGRGRSCI